uniref:ZK1236.4 n=1 Tax=Aquarana catesbeiana TaxID=8400 RepID=C1C452_AQUCT|nr:ZK1236.4 [Aquarana catesbeiana]
MDRELARGQNSERVVVGDSCSEWFRVGSGGPQGSVLGPLLFNIFINDTKLCSGITSLQDVSNLQANLNTLSNWATMWQMRFNVEKCKVMHYAKNIHASYMLGGVQLGETVVEKDLGGLVDHKLNNNMQCQAAVSKASKVLKY